MSMSDNDNNSKLYKRVSANAKSTIRLKKIFSFLFVAYAIVLLMLYVVKVLQLAIIFLLEKTRLLIVSVFYRSKVKD